MKMKKKTRFVAGVLAVTMLISSNSVFATTTAKYDEQIGSIKSRQAENEAEAERLNEKLDSLRSRTSEAEAYQATLEERDHDVPDEHRPCGAEHYAAQYEHHEPRNKVKGGRGICRYICGIESPFALAGSGTGGNLTTLQILFDSTSLYDFSMRSEAMKTITKHDRELMEENPYRIQTQDQRDELNKEKGTSTRRKTLKKAGRIAGARGRKPEARRRAECPEQRDGKRFGGGRGGEGRLRFAA